MTTATIQVQLDSDTARIFAGASEEDRKRLCALWGILVHEYSSSRVPLRQLMDEIGRKAMLRGLTQEELDNILNAG
jgi:hypothetical protein